MVWPQLPGSFLKASRKISHKRHKQILKCLEEWAFTRKGWGKVRAKGIAFAESKREMMVRHVQRNTVVLCLKGEVLGESSRASLSRSSLRVWT